ncbi:unnamed protein product [Ophioblennius macclurei]
MTASKYRRSLNKKLNSERDAAVSILRKENIYLKKILTELSCQHSQHHDLVQGFLLIEMLKLENSPLAVDEPSQQKEANSAHGDSSSCEETPNTDEIATELRYQLKDALEKNKQWLDYDQGREAYVKAILDRMLWLENQLNEANQARSQQHNEAHSDEKERMLKMQEYYEKLLQKAKDELGVLREQINMTQTHLITTQKWCKEKEKEVEALRQQLDSEGKRRRDQHHCNTSEDEEEELSDESEDLQTQLREEKRRSVSFMLQEDQQARGSYEAVNSKSELTVRTMTSTPRRSLLDKSFLECPKCRAEYTASRYQELLAHIDICAA